MERYYSFKQYDNKVFAVTEHYGPSKSHTFFVVWSRERCGVIDPGLGLYGDMRKYVEGFTGFEKAIFAICTNGTPEAVGAVGLFDEAFANTADVEMAKENLAPEARLAALKKITDDPAVLGVAQGDNIVDNSRMDIYDFHDPKYLRTPQSTDHFHMGGIHIGGEPLPGYTPGSMVMSIHGDDTVNIMYTGKSLSQHTNYLQNLDRAGMEKFRDCLAELIRKAEEYTKFPAKKVAHMYFISADSPEAFYIDTPKRILAGVESLLRGETATDMPVTYEGRSLKLHMAGSATILYDPALF